MMIDSISNSSSYYYELNQNNNSSVNQTSSLTNSQKSTIEDVLSNYDASSLSTQDAQEIVSQFQDANIKPSQELADTISSYGFDAQEIGSLAGVVGNVPPPPPPPSVEEQNSISSILDSLLNDDEDNSTSTSFETILDYTSRILSLNNDAKESVKELLDNYSPENTDLSRVDAKTVVQNSLSQILNNKDNYDTTSFYA